MSLRCLITAGPTREFFDPVRFVSNPSTGKMGFALAAAAQQAGWTVDLVAGPVALPGPDGAFGAETNRLIVLGAEGFRQVLGPATKTVLAQQLIALLLQHLTVRAR